MRSSNRELAIALATSVTALLVVPVVLPSWRFMFFAPFLIRVYYRRQLLDALWVSLGCGVAMDLLASNTPMGLHALNYTIVTWVLYRQKRNFFEDKPSTLSLMTFFFSLLSTLMLVVLMALIGGGVTLSFPWIMTDLVIMPGFDAAYAMVLFWLLPQWLRPRRVVVADDDEEVAPDRPR